MTRLAELAGGLIDWFSRHGRDLPWRRTRDPYAIWVSEVMLQQTQVKSVVPYWERWMAELPDVASLANSAESRVLKLWEGLGYYRRARHLRAAARVILERHAGEFPRDFASILKLPGVGRYTAGAISSIAFNRPTAILDGNVVRVLTRLQAIGGDPRHPAVRRRLWRLAECLVEAAAAGRRPWACSRLNQAIMDLGATLCAPRGALCEQCPVSFACRARARGRPNAFPRTTPRPTPTPRFFIVIVAGARGRYCVRQRPDHGLNGGLWEFPNSEVETPGAVAEGVARRLFGVAGTRLNPLTVVRHSITRFRMIQQVYALDLATISSRARRAGEWRSLAELEPLAFTSAHRRILRQVREEANGRGDGPSPRSAR